MPWLAFALSIAAVGPEDDGANARAKSTFSEGLAAMEAAEYARAKRFFSDSLREQPTAPAAFNLALAARALGDYLLAESTLERLLNNEFGTIDRADRKNARALRQRVESRIARLTLKVVGEVDAVSLDGSHITLVDGSARVELNPGEHIVVVQAQGARRVERFKLGEGETDTLELTAPLAPPASLSAGQPITLHTPAADEEESWLGTLVRSPVFWVVAGVLVVGGASVAWATRDSGSSGPEPNLGSYEAFNRP
ncbi:MAG: hypothetical protein AAF219_04150 [Myxococcota bacterium]